MNDKLIVDQIFEGIDFTENSIKIADYDGCTFLNCNLSKESLSGLHFFDCHFKDCNLSNVQLFGTSFKEVAFHDCKILGTFFENCDRNFFEVDFEGCQLTLSSFFGLSLVNTKFKNCDLVDVDFTESRLTGVQLLNCNLEKAIFERTILNKADYRSSINYSIDPERNKINGAKFSLIDIRGLLNKYKIEIE